MAEPCISQKRCRNLPFSWSSLHCLTTLEPFFAITAMSLVGSFTGQTGSICSVYWTRPSKKGGTVSFTRIFTLLSSPSSLAILSKSSSFLSSKPACLNRLSSQASFASFRIFCRMFNRVTCAACRFIFSSFSSSSFGSISSNSCLAEVPPSSASYQSRSSCPSSGSSGSLTSMRSTFASRVGSLWSSYSSSLAAVISLLLPLKNFGLPACDSFCTSWAFSFISLSSTAAFLRNSCPAFQRSSLDMRLRTASSSSSPSCLTTPSFLNLSCTPPRGKPAATNSRSGSRDLEASRCSFSLSALFSLASLSRPSVDVFFLNTIAPSRFKSPPCSCSTCNSSAAKLPAGIWPN
mmetsp:Transcript_598/g.1905  ORF Transcript_598/g.1905 Transcript_598/m.1905 type:complete len:348 (-) Transcript_598:27-1070(-)